MNIELLCNKLLEAARRDPSASTVPFAFEKRVMARLAALKPVDVWNVWASLMWKAAAPCVAIALVLAVWSHYSGPQAAAENIAIDLEKAVLAPVMHPGESW